jgi:hypothetical protein
VLSVDAAAGTSPHSWFCRSGCALLRSIAYGGERPASRHPPGARRANEWPMNVNKKIERNRP